MCMNELAEHQEWLYGEDHRLPNILGVFPQLKRKRLNEDTTSSARSPKPSVGQDLFVNQNMATVALQLLWQFIREFGRVTPMPAK